MSQIINGLQGVCAGAAMLLGAYGASTSESWGWPVLALGGIYYLGAEIYRLKD